MLLPNFNRNVSRAVEVGRKVALATWALVKSAGNLAGAAALVALGGVIGFNCLSGIRLPDSVLLQKAIEAATRHVAATPSAMSERDEYLIGLGFAAMLLLGGIGWLANWWNHPLGKPVLK